MPRETAPAPPGLDPHVARLAALVAADGRTRGEIAGAAGLRPDHLYQVLTGRRADPNLSTVARILAALGRGFADLDVPPGQRPRRKERSS